MQSDAEQPLPAAVLIFCGPNGAGKSTITRAILEDPALFNGEYINADDIAKSLEKQIPDYFERNKKAAGIADERRQAAIKAGRTFAFETVMSTEEKIALMTQAKAAGYTVSLVFVTTDHPDKNISRIASRVAQGGHPVDPDTVRKRYHSTMGLLACAIDHADNAQIFDNSYSHPVAVAIKTEKELIIHNPTQHAWASDKLVKPYQERAESRQAITNAFDAHSQNAAGGAGQVMRDADASQGKTYAGVIIEQTKHHVLQQTGANVFLVHDRALLAPQQLQTGKNASIRYAYDKGKVIVPPEPTKTPSKGIDR